MFFLWSIFFYVKNDSRIPDNESFAYDPIFTTEEKTVLKKLGHSNYFFYN